MKRTLRVALSSGARRVGTRWLVAPVVALREGVLHASNSQHAELVTAEEFSKDVEEWDGKPVVIYHPQKDGVMIAAREEDAVGHVRNPKADATSLTMEVWLDTERTPKDVVDRVAAGEVVDVSVGVFAGIVAEEGERDGKPYNGRWSNMKPDHLAVLPDERGACSQAMGCGLNRAAAGGGNPNHDKNGQFSSGGEGGGGNEHQGDHNTNGGSYNASKSTDPTSVEVNGQTIPVEHIAIEGNPNEAENPSKFFTGTVTGTGPVYNNKKDGKKGEYTYEPKGKIVTHYITGTRVTPQAYAENMSKYSRNATAAGGGNPNHDDKGQFSSSGSDGQTAQDKEHAMNLEASAQTASGTANSLSSRAETQQTYKDAIKAHDSASKAHDKASSLSQKASAAFPKGNVKRSGFAEHADHHKERADYHRKQASAIRDKKRHDIRYAEENDMKKGFGERILALVAKFRAAGGNIDLGPSDNEISQALMKALTSVFPAAMTPGYGWWIRDIFPEDNKFVYCSGGGSDYYMMSYTTDADGNVTLGNDAVEVEQVMEYRAVGNEPQRLTAASSDCGCGGKQTTPAIKEQENDMDKKKLVSRILAGKRKLFTEDDRSHLEQMGEERLKALAAHAEEEEPAPVAPVDPPKPETPEELKNRLLSACPDIKAIVEERRAKDATRRAELVGQLKTAGAFTEDELNAMPLDHLEKTARLASIKPAVDNVGRGGPRALAGSPEDNAIPAAPDLHDQIRAARAGK